MLFSLLPGAGWQTTLTVRKVVLIDSLSQAHSKHIVLFVLILMAGHWCDTFQDSRSILPISQDDQSGWLKISNPLMSHFRHDLQTPSIYWFTCHYLSLPVRLTFAFCLLNSHSHPLTLFLSPFLRHTLSHSHSLSFTHIKWTNYYYHWYEHRQEA